ncbi:MAG: hypothetical protein IJR70_02220 [Eubacterium sp.]|nr:hypothetical protein [Eubacterium sp.]
MIKDIPFIAHMFIIKENVFEEKETDNSYYNSSLDFDSEYCQNTTAWD